MTNPSRDELREHEGGPELLTTRQPNGRRTKRPSLCDCCRSGPGDRPAPLGSGDELRVRRLPCRDGSVILTTLPSTDVERGRVAFCTIIGWLQHIRTCHSDACNAVWQALWAWQRLLTAAKDDNFTDLAHRGRVPVL